MSDELKIGMIGLDTSHCSAFTKLLNDPSEKFAISGGRVTVGYPGGSADIELSYSRVDKVTSKLRDEYGVKIVDSIEAVAENVDAIMITSVDGRIRLKEFEKVVSYGKPVYISKPFTCSTSDAKKIVNLASEHHVSLMTCSILRYAESFTQTVHKAGQETVYGADMFGPMNIEPTQPGFFWYGIHTVEMLYSVLGNDCKSVHVTTNEDQDIAIGVWENGAVGTVRGNRKGNDQFGALIHTDAGTHFVNTNSHPKSKYASTLEKIIHMFKTGEQPVDLQQSIETIRFIEAANESRRNGKVVHL
ncbi:Gfo/Idh/MocA family protein [Alteribacter populi]|uniref:Gfo/Idh/MocA family protein n=1 Tax=Alteribacter populi TaxID=2011011 RepID=UPI000BBA60BF|nr:Gfo/Idh/MocA family oxidoreductase [Alteribacter populi]